MVTAVSLDVSVVVPVFNAGVNLDGCVRALLAQTLPADRYEIVLVDDGSTDSTAADLDAWAAAYPERIRVFHEPHSGGPGGPRNVGADRARGDYVHFVDSDDVLTPGALERVLRTARESNADVVLPKSASDFRGVNHDLYRGNVSGVTWADLPVVESLVPHKLVRRALIAEHGLRFPERIAAAGAPRFLEDQLFVVHAYAHARSVSVVADEVCYLFRRRRGFGRHYGDIAADPDDYYGDLEDVLDVIDRHVPDEELRRRLYSRFYRVEVLGRLRDRAMLEYDDDYRRRLFHRVRQLVEQRFPPDHDELLPTFVRRQAELVRAHDLPALLRHARDLNTLSFAVTAASPTWRNGALQFTLAATGTLNDAPCRHVVVGTDYADVVVVSRDDSVTWFVPSPLEFVDDGRGVTVKGDVVVDPRTLMGGRPLTAGLWDLRLRVRIGGVTRTARLAPVGDAVPPASCLFDEEPRQVEPYWTDVGGLALDVGGWSHSLTWRVAAGAKVVTDGRRWTVADVVAPSRLRRHGQLLARDERGASTARRVVLQANATGSVLTAERTASASPAWLRLGDPGAAEPVELSPQR